MIKKKRFKRRDGNNKKLLSLQYISGIINDSCVKLSPNEDLLFYAAGNKIVIYNIHEKQQIRYLSAPLISLSRSFSCIDVSYDGKYLIAGEKSGPQLCLYIWQIDNGKIVATLKGHKFGIEHCIFSSKNINNQHQYIVSVGNDQDRTVKLWDWCPEYINNNNDDENVKNCCELIAGKRLSTSGKMGDIAFAPNATFFVSGGEKSYRMWKLEEDSKDKNKIHLQIINSGLGPYGNETFVSVCCSEKHCYALTKKGVLCMYVYRPEKKVVWDLEKWVDIKIGEGCAMDIYNNILSIAGTNGRVRIFDGKTLAHLGTIGKPLSSEAINSYPDNLNIGKIYAKVVSLSLVNNSLICYYDDRSIIKWNIKNPSTSIRELCLLHHNDAIWAVTSIADPLGDPKKTIIVSGSTNNSMKFWTYPYDIPNLLVPYLMKHISANDLNDDNNISTQQTMINADIKSLYSTANVLITGDTKGILRLYSLPDYHLLCTLSAHNSDILAITCMRNRLLMTGSRDRTAKLYNISNPKHPQLLANLTHHSAAVTGVSILDKIIENNTTGATPRELNNNKTKKIVDDDKFGVMLITCGADQSIVFSELQEGLNSKNSPIIKLCKRINVRGTVHNLYSHPTSKFLLSAGSDKHLHIYTRSGKELRSYDTNADITKAVLDPSGSFIAASFADRSIRLYDWLTGNCIANVITHAQVVTDLHFPINGRYLISVSADGCLAYWKLNKSLSRGINRRMNELKIDIVSATRIRRSTSMEVIEALRAEPPTPPPPSNELSSAQVPNININSIEPNSPMFIKHAGLDKMFNNDDSNKLPNWARSTLNPPTLSTPTLGDSSGIDTQSSPVTNDKLLNTPKSPQTTQPITLPEARWISSDDGENEPSINSRQAIITNLENSDEVILSSGDDDDDDVDIINDNDHKIEIIPQVNVEKISSSNLLKVEDIEDESGSLFGENTSDRELLAVLGIGKTKKDNLVEIEEKKNDENQNIVKLPPPPSLTTEKKEEEIINEEKIIVQEKKKDKTVKSSNFEFSDQIFVNMKQSVQNVIDLRERACNNESGATAIQLNEINNQLMEIRNIIDKTLNINNNNMENLLENYSNQLLKLVQNKL